MAAAAAAVAWGALVLVTLMAGRAGARLPHAYQQGPHPGNLRFDGVGGVSGGGGATRLLLDYEEPYRSQILDLLFKPGFGASLQLLKVEVGCDGDTTQGSEQAHRHYPGDVPSFTRGYEAWFMREAKQRRNNILLSGLPWGVPGFVPAANPGSFYSNATADYLVEWVGGTERANNLTIDSIGVGYNEHSFNRDYIVAMRHKLRQAGLSHVRTIASDQCCGGEFSVAKAMLKDPELADAVDIIGSHCPGPLNGQADVDPSFAALRPLWDTEQHLGLPDPSPAGCYDWAGAVSLARIINGNYFSYQSSTQLWTPIYSWYAWLPYKGKGLMAANTPWSGYYNVTDTLWTVAHTTQFTEPGWMYVGNSSQLLDGGSFVTLVSPDGREVTIVIETFTANATQAVAINLDFLQEPVASLGLWTTEQGRVFEHQADVPTPKQRIAVEVPANQLWTLSTRAGTKGSFDPPPSPAPWQPTLTEDFEAYSNDSLPRFFSDLHGAFSVVQDTARGSQVLRQHATSLPVCTHEGRYFATALGAATWQGYSLSVMARAETLPGLNASEHQIFFGSHLGSSARPEGVQNRKGASAVLTLSCDGSWTLTSFEHAVAKGTSELLRCDVWLHVELGVEASGRVTASVNQTTLFAGNAASNPVGPLFLGCGVHHAQWDDVVVSPLSLP